MTFAAHSVNGRSRERSLAVWTCSTGSSGPTSPLDQLPEAILPPVPLLECGDELFMCGEAAVIVDGQMA